MGLAAVVAARVMRAFRMRTRSAGAAPRWIAALGLVFGLFMIAAPSSAWALPQCNVSFTVAENSNTSTYILNSTDLANCDPGFSGISPSPQTPANGGAYVPSAGGTYTTQSTANDDRIDYKPKAGFHGVETFQICGEPATTVCGTVTVTVTAATVSVSPSSLTAGTVGTAFNQSVSGSGGTSPYSFSLTSGALPAGLSLNTSTGAITGTPTAGGVFNFTVTASDSSINASGGASAITGSRNYNLTINAPTITVSPSSLSHGQEGSSFSQSITATGGTAPRTFAVTSGSLPTGVTLSSGGSLSGTPGAGTAGTYNFTITATDSSTGTGPYTGSRAYSWVIDQGPPTVTSVSPNSGSSAGGASVVITGTNFTGATGVSFGATAASFTVDSNTQITATSPAHAAGTVDVTVTTSAGTSATGAADQFTYSAVTISPTTVSSGTVGTAYSTTGLSGSGGTGPYTFAVTSGALPAGVSLASDGTFSGTPTAGGTFNFTVTATDTVGGGTGSRAFSMTVNAPTIIPTPGLVPSGTVGTAYSGATITALQGTAPYTFAVTSGALPAGLTLASNGTISGTPTAGGTFNFTITATDSSTGTGPYTGSRAYSMTINAPTITIAPNFPPNMNVGQSYSQTFTASGGTSTYTFAVTSGSIPAGMTLSSAGVLSGTPTEGGTFNFTITATDSSTGTGPYTGSHAYTMLAQAAAVTTSPTTIPNGTVGTAYSQTISGTNGTAPYTFQITGGALPAGLSLNATTGAITGTPTAAGAFTVFIVATDSSTGTGPFFGGRSYSFNIAAPTVTVSQGTAPTTVAAGQSFSGAFSASGGTSPYTFAVTSGALPAGVSLASNGTLSGTATAAGSFNFTVTATDSSTGTSAPFSGSQAFSLSVSGPTITLSPTSLTAGAVGTAFSQSVTASGGTSTYAYAVTAGALPAGLSLNASTGAITGTPTAAGSFNFTITATDSTTGTGSPFTGSRAYSLTINSPTITLAPTSLTAGTVGSSFSQSVSASGGTSTYSYAVTSGALPAGLSLNGSTGAITGTPTAGGTFNFTVTATDSSTGTGAPFTGSRAYSLTVNAPTITVSPTSVSLTQGVAAGVTFTASGGTSGYSFAVTGGSLPAGLSLASNGALTGSPTGTGSFSFTVTATDSSTGTGPYTGSRLYSGTVAAGIPTPGAKSVTVTYNTATPIDLSTVITGAAASSVTVTTGASHGSTSVSGTTVTYTPTTGFHGTDSFQYSATGPGGTSPSSATVSITVSAPTITVSPGSLTAGTAGTAYSQTISASGGQTPYAFAVTSGALPAGLSLNSSSGVLSGTPTASGSFNFTVTATDSSTGLGPVSGSQAYTLVIAKGTVTISPTTLPTITKTVPFSQMFTASGGVGPYAFSLTSGSFPAGLTLNGATGVLQGTPTGSGAYSFTITATDSTGGTGPATGSQAYSGTVLILPPNATGKSVSVVYNTATPIDLTNQVTGESTGVHVSTGPAHGSTSVSGYVVTYTPANGFFGSDSFQYMADGPGGSSTAATVNINVALPAPPTANNTTVTLPYGATTLAIDLSSVMTGVATNVQVMSQPAHGSAAATGTTVNFTLLSDFTGSDSFNYKAVGPGGVSSNTATVTIVRGNPPAPTAAGTAVTVDYGSPGKAIDLTNSITGVASSVTVSSPASHGTTSVSGKVVTYVPTPGYQGPDSFQYTATGAGGTSAPATVTITVTAPAAPVANAKSASTPYLTAAQIDLTSSVTGAANTVSVSTPASHGTTSASGMVVTYTPAAGFYGTDTFAYTATGAGGTSAPATVTVTVGTPPAPTAAGKSVNVPYASAGTQIDLTSSITGVSTSIATASNPAHGSVSVSGNVVTYTPAATYYGADSFTYRATGPGGTSSPATVSITVSTPPAPTAAGTTVGAAYNSAGTAIDLTPFITGVATNVTVSTAPTHGTATASGKVVTYKPTAGYFGPDSFAYTATGPGGTSSPATVTVNVGSPPAPFAKARSVSVPYNSAGVAIDMTSSVTGVASSVAVVAAPTKGSVTASGMSFTYTPTPGAFGADSFTYTASGTGGTSNTETVSVTIAPPPAPTVTGDTATVDANGGNQAIDLSGDVSGVFTRLTVTVAPSHGTLRISGTTATYKPATDYVGPDSFMFTATGPGGTSAPATVNITVRGADHSTAVPTAQAFTATTVALTPVTVDLAQGSTGGPITGANVTSVSPSGAGTTAIVQAGSSFNMTFTPGPNFVGTAVVNFTLSSAGGTSAPSTVTITVTRPNPAANAEVKGLVAAQDQATRTFARAQISNFDRRMEDLHAQGGGGSSFGVGLNFGDYGSNQYIDPNQNPLERMRLEETSDPFHQADQFRDAKLFADGSNGSAARGQGRLAAGGAGSGTMAAPGGAAIWAAGTIDLGQRSAQLGQDKVKFQSSGLTVGADMPVGEHWIMGAGVGWGHSDDQVGSGGTKSTATNWVGAIYASWEPAPNLFLDGVVGAGSLKFDTRRLTPALDFVTGSRNGSETFGSLTLAYEWRSNGLHLSPYGRLDAANASLHGYAETGNTTWALTYGSQKANLLSGDLGLRGDWIVHQGYGDMLPHFRIEARHEFEGSNAVNLQYSAALSGPTYTVTPVPASRDTVDLGIGSDWSFKNGFLFSLDYDAILADQTGNDQRFTIKLKKTF